MSRREMAETGGDVLVTSLIQRVWLPNNVWHNDMVVSQSEYGFQTRLWGVCTWPFLHMISLNFPVRPTAEDRRRYLGFFQSLQWVLPCKSCRESYAKFITARGKPTELTLRTVKDRESVARWMYAVHCAVSNRIGKETTVSFEGMCRKFERFRAGVCGKHSCDVEERRKRKRAVVLVMDDDTYKKLAFKSSLVEL